MKSLKDRISLLLKENGDNPNSFAKRYDLTQQSVTNWISGKVHPPERTLRMLAQKTGCNYQWLSEGTGDMFTNVPTAAPEAKAAPSGNTLEEVLKELRELRKVITTMAQANSELTAMLSRGSKLLGNRAVPMPLQLTTAQVA